jgi:hypothetical protein
VGQVRTAFEKALERAAVPDFRLHDLWHTAASHTVMRRRPLKEIQEVLSHKSFTLMTRYAQLSPMHLRTAVQSLEHLTCRKPSHAALDGMAQEMAQTSEIEHQCIRPSLATSRVYILRP